MFSQLMLRLKALPLLAATRFMAVAAVALDVISAYYFVKLWQQIHMGERLWQLALMLRGENWYELEPAFRQELLGISDITAATVLLALLLMNSVFYLYLLTKKKWAWQYAFTYSWTAALLQLTTLSDAGALPLYWIPINLLVMLLYLALGVLLWARKGEFKEKSLRFKLSQNQE